MDANDWPKRPTSLAAGALYIWLQREASWARGPRELRGAFEAAIAAGRPIWYADVSLDDVDWTHLWHHWADYRKQAGLRMRS